MAAPTKKRMTLANLLVVADHDRLEILGGELVEKALPSWRHAHAEAKYGEILAPFNRKAGGSRGPGGWWIGTEVHVGYGDEIYCHDVAGWRRERVPAMPDGFPVPIRPDWVCEIVSPNHEKRDFVDPVTQSDRDHSRRNASSIDARTATPATDQNSRKNAAFTVVAAVRLTLHTMPSGAGQPSQ
jgi:Uma2 family endonuclease